MFEIKITKNNIETHKAYKDTLEEANEYVNLIKSKNPCPWGLLERNILLSNASQKEIESAIATIPEVSEVIEGETVIISPAMITLPQNFSVEIVDKTAEHQAKLAMDALIQQGEENERKCRKALAYIGGYNESRNLTPTQINTMQATFGTVFQMLLANRPNTAKSLIQEITVDELVTQELKDNVIGLLS